MRSGRSILKLPKSKGDEEGGGEEDEDGFFGGGEGLDAGGSGGGGGLAEEDEGEVVAGDLNEIAEAEGLPVAGGDGSSVEGGAVGAEVAEGELGAGGG